MYFLRVVCRCICEVKKKLYCLLDIQENFLDNVSKLAFSLLNPHNLIAKKQQGYYLTGEMLLERFKVIYHLPIAYICCLFQPFCCKCYRCTLKHLISR